MSTIRRMWSNRQYIIQVGRNGLIHQRLCTIKQISINPSQSVSHHPRDTGLGLFRHYTDFLVLRLELVWQVGLGSIRRIETGEGYLKWVRRNLAAWWQSQVFGVLRLEKGEAAKADISLCLVSLAREAFCWARLEWGCEFRALSVCLRVWQESPRWKSNS